MKTVLKVIGGLVVALVVVFTAVFTVAALSEPNSDPEIDMNAHGAGASSVEPSWTGLQREFPPINAATADTAEQIRLGEMLFFDPVLSGNNEIACASCHHPDLGFSDGRPTSIGVTGNPVARNAPTLWNVAYNQHLFWDGREESLESQVNFPLAHPDEMGVGNTADLLTELEAIPAYGELFTAAFGNDNAITEENMSKALAAYQRTLITNNSPFDRYVTGEFEALSAPQRRGLALFRSGATRCFECHAAPTFATETFRVVGVPSDDPGRAGIVADGQQGAFKVPTLRNIALTAPYMHNGSLATLEEVIQFYEDGGGLAHGQNNVDPFVNGFELNEQEKADLLAFLYALTDESRIPGIPPAVPSGLPVVTPVLNSGRFEAAAHNVGGNEANTAVARDPQTLVVQEGESIQAVVDRAQPGDTIQIPYGTYHERVFIDMSDITIEGLPNENGEYPLFDGQGTLPEAFLSSGNNFKIGNLHIIDYTDNGVLVEGVRGVHFHDIIVERTGAYGVYPVQSTGVLIERIVASGIDDAGIYAGQCEDVIVRDSEVFGNVIGIELENTLNGEIYNNHAHGNTVGILVVLLPQLTSKISRNTLVYDNVLEDNNLANFGRAGATVSLMPPGVGILVLASDNAEVYDNEISGNKTAGTAVFSLTRSGAFNPNEIDVGPRSEGAYIHNNTYDNNGYDPDPSLADMGIPGADVLWDGSGAGNRFDEGDISQFPPILPRSGWPEFFQRGYSNLVDFIIEQVS